MTSEEARTVLEIMTNADGGCSRCVAELFVEFLRKWPEHTAVAQKVWGEEFEEDPVWLPPEGEPGKGEVP